MDERYQLVEGPPSVEDYVALRASSGLRPKRLDQAAAGIDGAWAAAHVVERSTGKTVGMGRCLGDGGWYFHLIDMATLPEHQRRGIGSAVLSYLIGTIDAEAPEGAFISLLADAPGRPLYERFGFTDTTSLGMALRRTTPATR